MYIYVYIYIYIYYIINICICIYIILMGNTSSFCTFSILLNIKQNLCSKTYCNSIIYSNILII